MISSPKYSLQNHLRNKLREPIGFLVKNQNFIESVKKYDKIVSVGDLVTYNLLSNNIKPFFCVIDYQNKRQENKEEINQTLRKYGNEVIKVNNPAAMITNELWNVIKDIYINVKTASEIRVEVDGEEDLAALPAILMAPVNVTIIYGLPDKGVVIVPSTDENKQKVKDILLEM